METLIGEKNKSFISFVVPLFNEEECVKELYSRICGSAGSIGMNFEIVFVNDHSFDSTFQRLLELREKDSRIRIISFSRNFGHQVAVMAGLRYASGDCVIVMDGDLQDPPEIVTQMVAKWQQGYKVVYAVRRNREAAWFMRICYKIFYRLLCKVSQIEIALDAGDFCLMDRQVVYEMRRFNEERPFVRGLRSWVGFKQAGIEYDRPARKSGSSKYTFSKLLGLAVDGLVSFSDVVLKVAIITGLIVSFVSIGYALYIGINRILIALGLIDAKSLIPGWATLICSIMFLIGLLFIFLGIIGEYIGRIYTQVKTRPLYIIEEKLGFEDNE